MGADGSAGSEAAQSTTELTKEQHMPPPENFDPANAEELANIADEVGAEV